MSPDRVRLTQRRVLWQRWKETGDVPETRATLTAAERRKRRLWWIDADDDEEPGRPPPRNAADPLGNGSEQWQLDWCRNHRSTVGLAEAA